MGNNLRVQFRGAAGDELAARLDLPSDPPRAYALFAHCFTCSKDIHAATRVSSGLAARGIAVLRFDFTGLGHSDGEFANTNFTSNVKDLLAAAAFLRESYEAPRILIGHSLGGAAVLAAAGDIPEARAVATLGAPFDPRHVSQQFSAAIEEIEERGEAEVSLGGRPFVIKRQFLVDIAAHDQKTRIAQLNKALLVLHSPVDNVVGIESAASIYAAAKHPKSFVTLDGADHLLSGRADAAYVADIISTWAARYLDEANARPGASAGVPHPQASAGEVIVAEAGQGRFRQAISVGPRHRLVADEPEAVGGDDTGPTPYDLVLAGLGACTTITLRMYAERKGWPLKRVSVSLRHSKIHAEDCSLCETKSGKIDRIVSEITLTGELDEQQKQRLLEIADKCPVHRTLHSEVALETTLALSET